MSRSRISVGITLIFPVLALFCISPAIAQSAFVDVSHGGDIICAVREDKSVVCNSAINVRGRTPSELPPVKDLSASRNAVCAVFEGGELGCWGQESFGLLMPPTSGAPYISVSISDTHGCAINSDNAIECWGLSSNGRLNAPTGLFEQLSVSQQQACAVDVRAAVSCWGANDQGTTDVPSDLPLVQKVSAGRVSSCALLFDGSIRCWGRTLPVPTAGPYIDLETSSIGNSEFGVGAVCGINPAGRIDCVFTSYDDGLNFPLVQTDVPTGTGNTAISMFGGSRGCYVASDGDLRCFGREFLTDPPSLIDNMPVAATTNLRSETYSGTTVELIWDSPGRAFNVAGHEIQRNGEVVAFTQNSSSYLVDDIVPGEVTTFAVRRVTIEGDVGAFSESVDVVTGDSGPNPGPGTGDYQPPDRPFETSGLDVLVYGSSALELVWDRAVNSPIDGYEIRRNGEYIGFSIGTSFYDEVPSADRVYKYDVIPVNRADTSEFYGFASISVRLDGSESGLCF